jgi:SpoVK/Ycf46/Vps4 family AAA+-type ATPase
MPLEEAYMDSVFGLGCKLFLKKMEKGKFYSYQEISQLILESSVHRPNLKTASDNSSSPILDMAYIEAVIQSQYAIGNLRAAEKDGERYYSKVELGENSEKKTLATRISPVYKWDDIVLPPKKKKQLLEICSYIKNMPLVYESWGFEKHSRGKGSTVLFSGPTGTGKTMAAEIIAGELNLDMYKVNLSLVVSKYIGETEKNLNKIFKDAEDGNAVLFFDEADALFGKRSEIKDAHDRYANIEMNYILQKMEEHRGIAIFATNQNKNIDDAFIRRLRFIINFPVPNQEQRLNIWKKVFPRNAPLGDIDYKFLSKLQISGGNIKNIAIEAAFLAAASDEKIQMSHIMRAAKNEYYKNGKVIGKQESGKYLI